MAIERLELGRGEAEEKGAYRAGCGAVVNLNV